MAVFSAQGSLDGDFPEAGGAEEQFVLGVIQGLARRRGEPLRLARQSPGERTRRLPAQSGRSGAAAPCRARRAGEARLTDRFMRAVYALPY